MSFLSGSGLAVFMCETANQSLEPTRVGDLPLAAQLQR